MKKITGLLIIVVTVLAFVSCDPIENRMEMKGATTMEKINQYVSVTAEMRNGIRSNYLILKSDGIDALSMFDYGMATYVGTNGRVQLILPGDVDVIYTALNADGTKLQKTFTVNVEQCFDVPPEWELLCGTGTKVWTWDDQWPNYYGMGDAFADYPTWWCPAPDDQVSGEGFGATMSLTAKGAVLEKVRTNNTTETGSFSFDMDAKNANWSRSMGKFNTRGATVLAAKNTGDDDGIVYTFDILTLNENEMVLGKLNDESSNPNSDGWGQINFWMFKSN